MSMCNRRTNDFLQVFEARGTDDGRSDTLL